MKPEAQLVYDGRTLQIPSQCGAPAPGQMVGTDAERLAELAGRECYDGDTEVLTPAGWVRFSSLPVGSVVASVDPVSGRMEFQLPTARVVKHYVGRMYRVLTSKVSIFVTPRHRLLLSGLRDTDFRFRLAADSVGTPYRVRRAAAFDGETAAPLEFAGRSYEQRNPNSRTATITRSTPSVLIDTHQLPAWATLLGYIVAEGCAVIDNGGAAPVTYVYQKPETAEPIFASARGCGLPTRSYLDRRNGVLRIAVGGAALARSVAMLGRGAHEKHLPWYVFSWPSHLRERLLDALMAGDGTTTENGVRVYSTVSKRLADDVQRLLVMLGRPANINHAKLPSGPIYRVRETAHVLSSVNKHLQQDGWVDFDGDVFCVTVPFGALLTRRDDRVVVCGNCYDSLGKGRDSVAYHQHILEVGHFSVYEHYNFTVVVRGGALNREVVLDLANRPGVYLRVSDNDCDLRVTLNIRCLLDWAKWRPPHREAFPLPTDMRIVGNRVAPRAIEPTDIPTESLGPDLLHDFVALVDDEERWVSLRLTGSRGFSHEQVRHGDRTAISQRSTRYVNESESPWCIHPLVRAIATPGELEAIDTFVGRSRSFYTHWSRRGMDWLTEKGVDQGTARKQARGAARGFLGNALGTSMIFSASVAQWRRMLAQRCHPAADAEIRESAVEVLKCLRQSCYGDRFADIVLVPSPDGLGEVLADGFKA